MNEEFAQMQETLATLRAEMDEVKRKLKRMEKVINCGTEEDEKRVGRFEAHIECASLVIRQVKDPIHFAVHLGANEGGGYLGIHYQGESDVAIQSAILLHMENNEPHIQVRGKDWKPRTDTFIMNDCGATAMFSPGGAPAVLMRGQAAGGSVAVLQPDGKTRGALIHDENPPGQEGPATDLIFALPDGKTLLKLHADAGGGMINMGPPGYPNAAVMAGRENSGSILLRSPDEETSIALLAAGVMAQISAMSGLAPGKETEASLMVSKDHSSMTLNRPNGEKGVDLVAYEMSSNLSFHDETGESAVEIAHHPGNFSSLSLSGVSEHEGIRMFAGNDLSTVEVVSPDDPDTKVICMVNADKPTVMLNQEKRPLVVLGESGNSGTVNAYGPNPEQAGIACLAGGPVTGSLSLSMPDGTALLTLDGTDHGGRLAINNDLGFQRIAMGVHQESAGLLMNYTGNQGVQLAATEAGGVLVVCDAEGNRRCSLPDIDDTDL